MITANEARNLIDDEQLYKYKIGAIEGEIKAAASMGYTSADITIGVTSVRNRIVKELETLGFAVVTNGNVVKIGF